MDRVDELPEPEQSVKLSKAPSEISRRSQVIIYNLEQQLIEEREKRVQLEEELKEIKKMSDRFI